MVCLFLQALRCSKGQKGYQGDPHHVLEVLQGVEDAAAAELWRVEVLGQLMDGGQIFRGESRADSGLAQALEALQHVLVRCLQQLLCNVLRHLHTACSCT